jgi:hypothetical protein
MSEHKASECRNCGQTIYWHRAKSGKNYPTNSPTDRRAFHQCNSATPPAPAKPAPPTPPPPKVAELMQPTLEERVAWLEKEVRALRNQQQRSSQIAEQNPITDNDLPW